MAPREPKLTVSRRPARPTVIYDGECRFCLAQVDHWREHTAGAVDYLASSALEVRNRFPELRPEQLNRSVQFIDTDGRVYAGAHGALRALALAGRHRWLLRSYERGGLCAALLELGYRCVASQRAWLGRLSASHPREPRR